MAPEVIVNNALSDAYTVIEVTGRDRTGLLHELTNALSDLSLDITSAHITTFGEKAVDVFYVTDLTGKKLESETRQNVHQGTPDQGPRRADACSDAVGIAASLMRCFPVCGGLRIHVDRHAEMHGWCGSALHHGARDLNQRFRLTLRDFEHKLVVHLQQHAGA